MVRGSVGVSGTGPTVLRLGTFGVVAIGYWPDASPDVCLSALSPTTASLAGSLGTGGMTTAGFTTGGAAELLDVVGMAGLDESVGTRTSGGSARIRGLVG